ncbi:MAG: lipoyl synthase [Candidatus Omnitrophica bacterium]|nr:lipoyl synthase [Candidatus Omnitrophota bacterium]
MLKINSLKPLKRFPYWLRQPVRVDAGVEETKDLLDSLRINTVCQSARCPNIYDCFSRKKCTFLILGNYCTRGCLFCAIETEGTLKPPDKDEIFDIKKAVKELGTRHLVITSVTRDDLPDGGAGHFADCIRILKDSDADLDIEVLVPDFLGKKHAIEKVVFAGPDTFAHNVETVPRLYKKVRSNADYQRSLDVLRIAKESSPGCLTKSSLMVGLGERDIEVYRVMRDLKSIGCEAITIGQYLKPAPESLEVERFLHPEEFARFSKWAGQLGFRKFSCSPLARSSYLE